MPKLRNINPLGDMDVVGVGSVKAGETFEVSAELAKELLEQVGNYEPVEKSTTDKKD